MADRRRTPAFGGRKPDSGIGREGLGCSIDECTVLKTVVQPAWLRQSRRRGAGPHVVAFAPCIPLDKDELVRLSGAHHGGRGGAFLAPGRRPS